MTSGRQNCRINFWSITSGFTNWWMPKRASPFSNQGHFLLDGPAVSYAGRIRDHGTESKPASSSAGASVTVKETGKRVTAEYDPAWCRLLLGYVPQG